MSGPGAELHADLVGLLRGELDNAEVSAATRHFHGCDSCRDSLVETAAGHALLSRSAHTLAAGASPAHTSDAGTLRVADLEAAFPDEPAATRRGHGQLVLVAATVVAAGLGAGAQAWLSARDAAAPAPYRSASLEAVTGNARGTVSMTGAGGRTSMTIDTHDLPAAQGGQFYHAWLLDPATNKMLPLGLVGPSGTASFEISDRLLAGYSAVDVSLEDDDGDPQHAPTSVLRATYA